jgi:hypothetical protein
MRNFDSSTPPEVVQGGKEQYGLRRVEQIFFDRANISSLLQPLYR